LVTKNNKQVKAELKQLKQQNAALRQINSQQMGRRPRRQRVARGPAPANSAPYPSNMGKLARFAPHLQAQKALKGRQLSPAGVNFLKCAFAPPDFAFTGDMGIPDKSPNRRLLKRHRLVTPFTFASGTDYYFLVLPTPGVAAWTFNCPSGTTVPDTASFDAIKYSDFASLFGPGGTSSGHEADIVTAYRYVSNAFEIVPTANEMTWSGSIQMWKAPIRLESRSGTTPAQQYSIIGVQSVNGTNADMYVDKFTRGGYSLATKTTSEFEWSNILENQQNLPTNVITPGDDFGRLLGGTTGSVTGIGYMDAIIVKVSGITASDETAILKFWSCVEYQVNAGTTLYEYSHAGPPCDDLALELYNEIAKTLPVGVSYEDNEAFWQRVLRIIRTASGGLSVIPGPYGAAFGGVNAIASAIQELTM
jgi:hypothetical protein